MALNAFVILSRHPVNVPWKQPPPRQASRLAEWAKSLFGDKSPQLYIEHSVLKTIAAFLNSDGGTLLVGVDDDGYILGLDNDYSTFGKDKNVQDEWVKHFDNITGLAFGNAVMANINLAFAFIDGKAVAIIDVGQSAAPAFMKNKTENNRKQFYIRRNGSTVEIDLEETLAYAKQKWG